MVFIIRQYIRMPTGSPRRFPNSRSLAHYLLTPARNTDRLGRKLRHLGGAVHVAPCSTSTQGSRWYI
ncbi:hypothetical protein C8T65DRAFT_652819 [Cerioporus squamosus]|nr:hypothetical protein C8T65DRAFT_652819 [Cerioporus squamosus]